MGAVDQPPKPTDAAEHVKNSAKFDTRHHGHHRPGPGRNRALFLLTLFERVPAFYSNQEMLRNPLSSSSFGSGPTTQCDTLRLRHHHRYPDRLLTRPSGCPI